MGKRGQFWVGIFMNYNEPQMNTDEHRFRMQYPCSSVVNRLINKCNQKTYMKFFE